MDNTVTIYIPLLEEGSPAARGTQAVTVENGLYKVLPVPDYNPEDEIWKFLPGSIVKCKEVRGASGKNILLAFEEVK